MQSIQTKFIPATNTKGARIKAQTSGGLSVTIPYPYGLDLEYRHFAAVEALLKKHGLDWHGFSWGGSIDGRGYVFTFSENKTGF